MNLKWHGEKLDEIYNDWISEKAQKYYNNQDGETAMYCTYYNENDIYLENKLTKYFLVEDSSRMILNEFDSIEELNEVLECIVDEIERERQEEEEEDEE